MILHHVACGLVEQFPGLAAGLVAVVVEAARIVSKLSSSSNRADSAREGPRMTTGRL